LPWADQLSIRLVAGQTARAVKDGQGVIQIAVHPHLGLHKVTAMLLRGDLQHLGIEGDAVIVAHRALKMLAEDLLQLD